MVAGLRHALDDEVPKAGDIHLDAAGDAEAPRSFGRVVNLRQRILQQQVIGAEDPSLDREALSIHEQSTVPCSVLARQPKTPLSAAIRIEVRGFIRCIVKALQPALLSEFGIHFR